MIKIRPAIPEDTEQLCRMALEFYDDAGYEGLIDVDISSFIDTVKELSTGDSGAVFVLLKDEKICGMAGCAVVYPWMNKKHKMAQELFLWIDKEHRNAGFGVALMAAIENWAVDNGCKSVAMCCTSDLDPEKVIRMYHKLGYVLKDYLCIKAV